jgi:Kip1 ubiquitination-promoting complex protein 1
MYEGTVLTNGIQQLGWATGDCPFTNEEGVGDAPDSYAYDGQRVKKWNVACDPYGQPWVAGDVIGCTLDMDRGEISFYRNGESLGVAFDNVKKYDKSSAYFPAVSLSHGERCEVNFGALPFMYPVDGVMPLQQPPPAALLARAPYLTGCVGRLVRVMSGKDADVSDANISGSEPNPNCSNRSSDLSGASTRAEESLQAETAAHSHLHITEEDSALVAGALFAHLRPLLKSHYLINFALFPTMLRVMVHDVSDLAHVCTALKRFTDLLFLLLEPNEATDCLQEVLRALAWRCRVSFCLPPTDRQVGAHDYLSMAVALVTDDKRMISMWVKMPLFNETLEAFMSRKQPNKYDLTALMPLVWWHGATADESCSEDKMRASCGALSDAISRCEHLQAQICAVLMCYTPPDTRSEGGAGGGEGGAGEGVFHTWLRHLLWRNRGAVRNVQPAGLSDNSVLVSTYFVLLRALRPLMDEALKDDTSDLRFQPSTFLSKEAERFDLPRLGGALSHLLKSKPVDPLEAAPVPLFPPRTGKCPKCSQNGPYCSLSGP